MRIQHEGSTKDAEAVAGAAGPVVKKKTVKRKVVKPATLSQLPASTAPAIPSNVPDEPPVDFVETSVAPPLLMPASAAAPRAKRRNSRVTELRVATGNAATDSAPPVAGSGSDTNLASSARTAVSLPSGIGGANPTPPSGSTPPRTSHLASISETALGDHVLGLTSTSAPDLPVTKRQPTAAAAAGHSRSPATTWLPRGEVAAAREGKRAGGWQVGGRAGRRVPGRVG